MLFIGVDPGKHTGFAVWNADTQSFIELLTMDFWTCYWKGIYWQENSDRLMMVIEDPRGHSAIYARNRGQGGRQATAKIAQNVGGVKKEAQLLIDGFRRNGIVVKPVVPKQSKWDAKTFKNITGYKGRTNEHVRDSARLVFGMKAMPDAQYEKLMNGLNHNENEPR